MIKEHERVVLKVPVPGLETLAPQRMRPFRHYPDERRSADNHESSLARQRLHRRLEASLSNLARVNMIGATACARYAFLVDFHQKWQ